MERTTIVIQRTPKTGKGNWLSIQELYGMDPSLTRSQFFIRCEQQDVSSVKLDLTEHKVKFYEA